MKIFNIFCDASINIDTKTACGGCYISYQDEYNNVTEYSRKAIIQNNATNNSAEILAIWVGIIEVLKIRDQYPYSIFRLFSDSKISLYGLRDWMKNWVKNINPMDKNKTLISSSGTPVMNQQKFIDIYNIIAMNNLHIELYHQRGHVGESGKVNIDKARSSFIKANKVSPESLGVDIQYLSYCNSIIDNYTRDAIYNFESTGTLPQGIEIEHLQPLFFCIRNDLLSQYIENINKTSVKSYHDFKGGYNQ